MSHFTSVKTKLFDLEMVKKALTELGYKYSQGKAKVRGWVGNTQEAELVVNTGSNYDIGFLKNPSGEYSLVADWWAISNNAKVNQSQFVEQITQRYAYHKVLNEIKKKGFTVAEEKKASDGSIKLLVRKWQ